MEYQISEIVETAVNNLSKVAEVNTIIGKPIVAYNGATILPVSQINFAFMAGGGEYGNKLSKKMRDDDKGHFAGGSGGGASLSPVGFLVIDQEGIRMMKIDEESNAGKLIDIAMDLLKNDKGKKAD